MLLEASQFGADEPTQVPADPHLQTPLLQVSPELVQAETLAAHLQTLLAASQYGAVVEPTQVPADPQLQTPPLQVSPELVHCAIYI